MIRAVGGLRPRSPAGVALLCLGAVLFPAAAFVQRDAFSDTRPTVAVVGAGVGGSAFAHFLRHTVDEEVMIHVFERENIGGRAQHVEVDEMVLELGASLFVRENRYIHDLSLAMNLTHAEPLGGFPFGLWDGGEFVFNQSDWKMGTAWNMLSRYGLDAFKLNRIAGEALRKLESVYGMQEGGKFFETPEELLEATGLLGLTQLRHDEFLRERLGKGPDGAAPRIVGELVHAIDTVMYNQCPGINALAGTVALFPMASKAGLRVAEGNAVLMQRLLMDSKAHIHGGAIVTGVLKYDDHGYMLWVKREPAAAEPGTTDMDTIEAKLEGPFDHVVVAAPLELLGLSFSGMPCPKPAKMERQYQEVHTTLVRGSLRADYFGVEVAPDSVLLAEGGAGEPWGSIQTLRKYDDGSRMFKVFSTSGLTAPVMTALFSNITWAGGQPWHAYPKFSPPEQFSSFRLCEEVYYISAFENAVSTLETQAIAARNVALMVADAIQGVGGSGVGEEGKGGEEGEDEGEWEEEGGEGEGGRQEL